MRFSNATLTDLSWQYPDGELRFVLRIAKVEATRFDEVAKLTPRRDPFQGGHGAQPQTALETVVLYFSEQDVTRLHLHPTDFEHWREQEQGKRRQTCRHIWWSRIDDPQPTAVRCSECGLYWESDDGPRPTVGLVAEKEALADGKE